MPIAGAAAGAARSLEEIVAQRLLADKLRAEIAQQEQRSQLEQATLNERMRMNDADLKRTERIDADAADTKAAGRRERDNAIGVRRMIGESITQGVTPESRKTLQGMAYGEGVDLPQELITDPAPKKFQYTYTDPRTGQKSLKFATEDQIPPTGLDLGREPQKQEKAEKPQIFNVGNGKLVDANGKVIYGGGDSGGQSPYAQERTARTVTAVDDILKDVTPWSAGYGSLLANVPESDALNLKSKLNTLKANIAFNELTAMREASKTGGALGSVAIRELELLESALGSLDQAQSPKQLVENLNNVKASAERWSQVAGRKATSMSPVTSHGDGSAPSATPRRMRFDAKGNPIP